MSSSPLPNRVQSILSGLLLLALSLFTLPISILLVSLAYLYARACGQSLSNARAHALGRAQVQRSSANGRPRRKVLVNGGRMQKSLILCRALARKGCEVVLLEEEGWGELCATRFSSSVSSFHLVPNTSTPSGRQAYIDTLVRLALSEGITDWIPCSGAGSTEEDAIAGELMGAKSNGRINAIIQSAALAKTLHEKDSFISLVHSLGEGLEAPESHLVTSVQGAMDLLKDPSRPPMIIKCATALDDIGRSDMTVHPLTDAKTGQPDMDATEMRLRGLRIPITKDTPYILQEFVGGEGASEWCTHGTVVDGQVRAFVCCPSNDMLMTYHEASSFPVGVMALAWTRLFLSRLGDHPKWATGGGSSALQGQFSFDFIYQPSGHQTDEGNGNGKGKIDDGYGRLVAIECNPRMHTAIALLADHPRFADAFLVKAGDGKKKAFETVMPSGNANARWTARTKSWIGHDLPARILPLALPSSLTTLVHPLWGRRSTRPKGSKGSQYDLDAPAWLPPFTDPSFAWDDPIPFLALYHLQWPSLLFAQLVWRRTGWSRINASTARIFEC